MTRKQIIVKAIAEKLTWIQAADILGMSARHILSGPASYRPSGGIIQRVLRLLEPLSQRLPTLGQEPLDLLEMRWARSR